MKRGLKVKLSQTEKPVSSAGYEAMKRGLKVKLSLTHLHCGSWVSMKRGLKEGSGFPPLPLELLVSMKRGLKVALQQAGVSVTEVGLDEKRIERWTLLTLLLHEFLPSRWKEDWKLVLRGAATRPRQLSRWKEDWKINRRCSMMPPSHLVSMKRGLKERSGSDSPNKQHGVSMKRGLKESVAWLAMPYCRRSRWKEDWKPRIRYKHWDQLTSRLDEKRIERTAPVRTPDSNGVVSRWKEDWKSHLYWFQGGERMKSRWKEDWKRKCESDKLAWISCQSRWKEDWKNSTA